MNSIEQKSGQISLEWLFRPSLRLLFHILFWVFVFLEEILDGIGLLDGIPFDRIFFLTALLDVAMVYISIYIFLPRLLLKGKLSLYILSTVLLIVAVVILQHKIFDNCAECEAITLAEYLFAFIYSSFIVGAATGIKFLKHYIKEQKKINSIQQDQFESELVYLKDQMNPHFLFNSLNGIYVLNQRDPKMAGDAILKLSDILRYQLYESDKEEVPILGEVEFIEQFLELEKMRKKNLNFMITRGSDLKDEYIAPYILMPFVENAIKHSASTNEQEIEIRVNIDQREDDSIIFNVTNTIPESPLEHATGGIGIRNVKRRLDLVYPDRHSLEVQKKESNYSVSLQIKKK